VARRPPHRNATWALRFVLPIASLALAPVALAQEASRGDKPTSDTVEGLGGAMQQAFEPRARLIPRFPIVEEWVEKFPPFFRDTAISFQMRSFFWDSIDTDGNHAQAWAIGGEIDYTSGWIKDRLRIGAALYTSQPILAQPTREGSGLLRPDQRGYTVAGKAFAEFQMKDQNLKLYRQGIDLPYINGADSRMTPNTFEAYMVRGKIPNYPKIGTLNYVAGWISKIRRPRKAAGSNSSKGVATITLRASPNDRSYFGLTNHTNVDNLNIFYGEGSYIWNLPQGVGLRLDGQFTLEASIGEQELPGPSFLTGHLGLRLAASWRKAIFTVAGSWTAADAPLQKPWGFFPGYIGLMQRDFDRAGETAVLIGLSYDFSEVGVDGLSGFFNFAAGFDGREIDSSERFAGQQEFDITMDYRRKHGVLKGLWLRTRASYLHVEGAQRDAYQVRVILNFQVNIL